MQASRTGEKLSTTWLVECHECHDPILESGSAGPPADASGDSPLRVCMDRRSEFVGLTTGEAFLWPLLISKMALCGGIYDIHAVRTGGFCQVDAFSRR